MTATEILASLLWSAFVVWTVRRLWRRGSSEYERAVLQATRFFGVAFTVLGAPLFAELFPGSPWTFGATVVFLLVVTFPLAMWGGYLFGVMMAAVRDIPKDS